ncbi:MAG: hypothetical protein M3Z04_14550, partial [Chloroflexota bacterium]|nr:hypothetical protein [Chloroflexota bacterium]
AERSASAAPTGDGEDGATEQQQRQIRTLLPRAGMTESELLRSVKIAALSDLPRGRAAKVIERLTQRTQERGEEPAF